MVNLGTNKIYKNNQNTIPSKIRKELNITEDTLIDWDLDSNNAVTLVFKSRRSSIKDLAGLGKSKEKTNAAELKRALYN